MDVLAEIARYMPVDEFVRVQNRLAELRHDEELKLKALAELQQYYVNARSDADRDKVKAAVAEIRELSKKTRQEIHTLNAELSNYMPLDVARDLYNKWMERQPRSH